MANDLDPRTTYSLAMTVILYELYNSNILASQESVIPLLKNIVIALLILQLLFLFLKGFSFTSISDNDENWLSRILDFTYSYSFHSSVLFFVLGIFLLATSNIFIFLKIPPIILAKVFFILINLCVAVVFVYEWQRRFSKNNNQDTNRAIYISVILWSIVLTLTIASLK